MDTSKVVNELGLESEGKVQYQALKRVLSVVESQIISIKNDFACSEGMCICKGKAC